MWKNRLFALALSIAGGGLLAFLVYQSFDRALNNASITVGGMPASLLLGFLAILMLAFGLHRLVAGPAKKRP
jgi:phosphotransferase system  glucose/maltose/N-acetylglucosamine-specific IIC component